LTGKLFLIDALRLLAPWRPTLEPPVWVVAKGHAWAGVAGLAAGIALAAWAIRTLWKTRALRAKPGEIPGPAIATGILLCLTALLPVLQIIPANDVFGGRFLYLPAAGLSIGIGLWIAARKRPWPRLATGVFGAVILAMAARSGARANTWNSDERLFGAEYRMQPESIRARVNWAGYLLNAGRIDAARGIIEGTTRLLPDHPRVRYQEALLRMNEGRVAEAEATFSELARTWKKTPTLLANLAGCQMRLGRMEEGLKTLDEATRGSTPTAGMRNNRGIALKLLGRLPEARREFELAIAEDPSYRPARVNLIRLLTVDSPDLPRARRESDDFLRLFPDAPEAPQIRAIADTLLKSSAR
jgi:Flp pilus assembly protein TadD